jgi:hypothetical protein
MGFGRETEQSLQIWWERYSTWSCCVCVLGIRGGKEDASSVDAALHWTLKASRLDDSRSTGKTEKLRRAPTRNFESFLAGR